MEGGEGGEGGAAREIPFFGPPVYSPFFQTIISNCYVYPLLVLTVFLHFPSLHFSFSAGFRARRRQG
jgi:hypothetical protein